jgi:hypothetical protein
MTIERPMFPPRADEPSVIEFPKQPAKPAVVGIKRKGWILCRIFSEV